MKKASIKGYILHIMSWIVSPQNAHVEVRTLELKNTTVFADGAFEEVIKFKMRLLRSILT